MASVGSFQVQQTLASKMSRAKRRKIWYGECSATLHNYDVMNDLMTWGRIDYGKTSYRYDWCKPAEALSTGAPSCLPPPRRRGRYGDIAFRSIKAMEKAYGASLHPGEEAKEKEKSN